MAQLPQKLLAALGLDTTALVTPLAGNENENYLLNTGQKKFVIKKLRSHTADNTLSEAVYRERLAQQGLPVSPYLTLSDDSDVLVAGDATFVATNYIEGAMAQQNASLATQAGQLLAKTHTVPHDNLPQRQNWYNQHYIAQALNSIDNKYADAKQAMAAQCATYPNFWGDTFPRGIIHGDLQPDNIIVDNKNNVVSIIDWEETGIEPLIIDVAHAAQQLSFTQGVCDPSIFNAFMQAYQSIRPLSPAEKSHFNTALRYSMLVLSIWAHVKMSRHEIANELFQRVGNYYKTSYDVPKW